MVDFHYFLKYQPNHIVNDAVHIEWQVVQDCKISGASSLKSVVSFQPSMEGYSSFSSWIIQPFPLAKSEREAVNMVPDHLTPKGAVQGS